MSFPTETCDEFQDVERAASKDREDKADSDSVDLPWEHYQSTFQSSSRSTTSNKRKSPNESYGRRVRMRFEPEISPSPSPRRKLGGNPIKAKEGAEVIAPIVIPQAGPALTIPLHSARPTCATSTDRIYRPSRPCRPKPYDCPRRPSRPTRRTIKSRRAKSSSLGTKRPEDNDEVAFPFEPIASCSNLLPLSTTEATTPSPAPVPMRLVNPTRVHAWPARLPRRSSRSKVTSSQPLPSLAASTHIVAFRSSAPLLEPNARSLGGRYYSTRTESCRSSRFEPYPRPRRASSSVFLTLHARRLPRPPYRPPPRSSCFGIYLRERRSRWPRPVRRGRQGYPSRRLATIHEEDETMVSPTPTSTPTSSPTSTPDPLTVNDGHASPYPFHSTRAHLARAVHPRLHASHLDPRWRVSDDWQTRRTQHAYRGGNPSGPLGWRTRGYSFCLVGVSCLVLFACLALVYRFNLFLVFGLPVFLFFSRL
ncbi:unnamed protein product [Rhizoctonia solani]|uniref:Uncharacterized protein n=1 Tax=Rhizoctonia solani TaxID=456999 RepID=A0A8H3ANX0_9AGAM|nr:unnamed protein product [Rhizoctonia solani]CAE6519466.1 unnamed protein product [Rhizoctonia solani]